MAEALGAKYVSLWPSRPGEGWGGPWDSLQSHTGGVGRRWTEGRERKEAGGSGESEGGGRVGEEGLQGKTKRALGLERLEVAGVNLVIQMFIFFPSRSHSIFPALVQGISAPAFTAEGAMSWRHCLPRHCLPGSPASSTGRGIQLGGSLNWGRKDCSG